MFLQFTSKQTYRIFLSLYILCAIHHSLRWWYLLFKVKSGSRKISILVFSRFFVDRCHGNIDFHNHAKVQSKTNKYIAYFTLNWQGKDCLRADSKS